MRNGFFNADLFDWMIGLVDTGCVADNHRYPPQIQGFFDDIPRGSGNGADDDTIFLNQLVQQAGFAHVRSADDGHPQTLELPLALAEGERVQQGLARVSVSTGAGAWVRATW